MKPTPAELATIAATLARGGNAKTKLREAWDLCFAAAVFLAQVDQDTADPLTSIDDALALAFQTPKDRDERRRLLKEYLRADTQADGLGLYHAIKAHGLPRSHAEKLAASLREWNERRRSAAARTGGKARVTKEQEQKRAEREEARQEQERHEADSIRAVFARDPDAALEMEARRRTGRKS